MSLNVIIIAAIVLIVMVVLWAIFTGRMGIFTKKVQEQDKSLKCDSDVINGVVVTGVACPGRQTQIPGSFSDIADGTQVCCTKS